MSLLSGIKLVSDPTSPALTSNTAVTRIGVAADGVARLVVRFNAPASGTVAFSMVDTANNLSLASGPENGYLTDLSGNPPTTVPTVSNQGQRAFAVFIAPTRFVRAAFPSDAAVNQRQFSIQATFQSSGGNTPLVVTTAVVVVRPLVFLVHGLWTCKDSWTNFQPLISDQRFVTSRADYRDPPGTSCVASESFSASAATVYPQLKAAIQSFRASNNVAAIQADVVTHSMGGPVVRTMALQPTFLNDSSYPTFGVGPIHKLITIAGVHSGTPMANYLQSSLCLTLIFNSFNRPTMNGAVSDLETGSPAIAAIDGSAGRAFLANTVVGLASGAQVLANDSLFGGLVNFMCSATTPPFEFDLVLGTVNHDLMVPSSSQEASRSGPFSTVNGVVHSAPFLAPGGSQELLSSAIANQIIALLNANIDDPTMFAQF
jgi:pimeloyl-ACP methyl ester carboxylesterase